MAISDGTAGAWVATTTRNPTVTLPAHSAGQMILVRVGWKSATPDTDVAVCNTAGWAKLGQRYNGGGVSSNGGGGVLVAVFWKVATSAAETNPVIEFDDATAPNPGCYSPVTYSKASTDVWSDPVGDGGDIAAATSYSATMASHVSATSGDMLDAFAVTNDNTTLTVPTVSQTGLTLDTVTEYPATALSSATGNDCSADGCNRLATAGTSSAAAVVSGTNSVADPGTAWTTRLRVGPVTGSGGVTLPAPAISGTGESVTPVTGSGGVTLPAPAISGTAAETFSGSGGVTIPAPAISGTEEEIFTGSGGVTLPAPAIAAEGTSTESGVSGSGGVELPAAAISGTGTEEFSGSGGVSLPAPPITGTGDTPITGGHGGRGGLVRLPQMPPPIDDEAYLLLI